VDPREVGLERITLGQYVANAAAERIAHVLLRMAVGREIDPFPAPALSPEEDFSRNSVCAR